MRFLQPDGSVAAQQTISGSSGGLVAVPGDGDLFGAAVAGVGDGDRDGTPDLVVGAPHGGPADEGAVYVIHPNPDGTVDDHREISDTEGGLSSWPMGIEIYGMGILPPPGTYGQVFVGNYLADSLRDDAGRKAADIDLRATTIVPRFVWVTEQQVRGGNLGFHALLPLNDIRLNVKNGPHDHKRGIGDAHLGPVIGFHHMNARLLRGFERADNRRSHVWFRVYNEISVLLFAAIVALVVFKPF